MAEYLSCQAILGRDWLSVLSPNWFTTLLPNNEVYVNNVVDSKILNQSPNLVHVEKLSVKFPKAFSMKDNHLPIKDLLICLYGTLCFKR